MRKKTTVRDQTIEDHKGIGIHVNNPEGDVEISGGTMRRVEGIGIMIGEGPSIPELLSAIEARLDGLDVSKRPAVEAAIAETRAATTRAKLIAGFRKVCALGADVITGTLAALAAKRLGG